MSKPRQRAKPQPQPQMRKFILPDNILQALANYLARQPFAEVNGLITELDNLEQIKPELRDVKEA